MDITWGVDQTIYSSCKKKEVNIVAADIWKNIEIIKTVNLATETISNISREGYVYPNIPTSWYLVHN